MGISAATGLASGIDIEGLVARLMTVERQPLVLLQNRQASLAAKRSALGALAGKLGELRRQAELLADPGKFFPRSVTSSNDAVAVATASPGAGRGTFTLTVTGLARGSIAAAATTVGALTDTVAAGDGSFTFRLGADGADVAIPVTATTTLEQLVKAVNDANAGVRAAAINVGTAAAPAWKLTLTSNATGAANDIVVQADGTTLGITNTQAATDALFTVSGVGSFARASNTFADVIPGVTVTLKAPSGTTELAVDYSAGALQAAVQGLVNAYNDVMTSVASQSAGASDADGRVTPGVLSGEGVPRSIVASLRGALGAQRSGTFGRLSDIGVSVTRTGTVTLDPAAFQRALETDAQAVSDLVAGTGTTAGIADLLLQVVEAATRSPSGSLSTRQQGLETSIKDMQRQIDAGLERLTVRERVLRQQFLRLEETLGRLQQTQSALTSQLTSLANLATALSSPR
jgi:flagellar hook-associated protein 2